MFYKIIADNTSSGKLYMPQSFFAFNDIQMNNQHTVNAGIKSKIVDILVEHNIDASTFILSQDVIDFLSIPTDINYQIHYLEGQFHLGPVIGLLFAKKSKSFSEEKMLEYMEYAALYPEFHGLLCLFSEDKIDFENNLVEGYYLYSNENDNQRVWKNAVLPFPKSIYRRSPLSNSIRKRLIDCSENRLFNSHYLSKWEFWKMAKKVRNVKKHLPKTKRFRSVDDVDIMFEHNNAIYLKPYNGSLNNGLVKLTMINDCYYAQTNEDQEPVEISSKKELNGYLRATLLSKKYIMQQGIDTLKYEDRCTSFRAIMQKDQNSQWQLCGTITYLSKKGGICSKYQATSSDLAFENLVSNVSSISIEQAQLKKQEMINYCSEICKLLDMRTSNYADIGIDFGIDNLLRLWIFDVNCKHDQYPLLSDHDKQMYYSTKNYPIKYAVSQSGFNLISKE